MPKPSLSINFRRAKFYASYPDVVKCEILGCPQVAFVGRSNSGKSSLLNTLCDNSKLARTSNSPGRTQQLVFLSLEEDKFLVDLPGYGYAKTSKKIRQSWGALVEQYITSSRQQLGLVGMVIVVDSRRLIQENDLRMIELANFHQLSVCVFLTKSDKLNRQKQQTAILQSHKMLEACRTSEIMLGSSSLKVGMNPLREWLTQYLTRSDNSV